MTDLPDRLRQWADTLPGGNGTTPLLWEAADELERLQRENTDLESEMELFSERNDHLVELSREMRARLAAVQPIIDALAGYIDGPAVWRPVVDAWEARRAGHEGPLSDLPDSAYPAGATPLYVEFASGQDQPAPPTTVPCPYPACNGGRLVYYPSWGPKHGIITSTLCPRCGGSGRVPDQPDSA
jgi:hypothetical protein